jgi:glycosyltransferase involved in cell wall biosynthesis
MKISVCLCTWNRQRLLANTLAHFQQLTIPVNVDWELVIVDNASSDETPQVIERYAESLPIKSFVETTPGHCAARNKAVASMTGDFVLWTDDDVEVHTDWLKHYSTAFARQHSNDFWGGPIEARFESPKPDWIEDNWDILSGCFAVRDIGREPVQLNRSLLPYGANFAVRGSVQKEFRFDQSIGRNRTEVVGGDEINLMQRLIDMGHSGQWLPSAKVFHIIPDDRATERYVFDYFVGQGKLMPKASSSFARLKHRLLQSWHRFRFRRTRAKGPSRQWLSHLINTALHTGQNRK